MTEVDIGVWISGFVSGIGLTTAIAVIIYLICDSIVARRR